MTGGEEFETKGKGYKELITKAPNPPAERIKSGRGGDRKRTKKRIRSIGIEEHFSYNRRGERKRNVN